MLRSATAPPSLGETTRASKADGDFSTTGSSSERQASAVKLVNRVETMASVYLMHRDHGAIDTAEGSAEHKGQKWAPK